MTSRDLSRSVAQGGAQAAPAIAVLSPDTGSTGGSTPLKICGAGFEPGAVVFIDGIAISAFVLDSGTIYACAPPHDAGPVDVVVVNPSGLSDWVRDAYMFVPPQAFDFNGDWIGVAGSEHQMEIRFTVQDDVLVSVSCGGSGKVTFSPPPRVEHGEFSVVRSDGVGITARIVSATEAVGTINIEPCPYTNWIATRSVRN